MDIRITKEISISGKMRHVLDMNAIACSIFSSSEWYQLLAAHILAKGESGQFYWGYEGDREMAMLPMLNDVIDHRLLPDLQGLRNLENYYTPLFKPLGSSESNLELILEMVNEHAHCDYLQFSPLDVDSDFYHGLVSLLDKNNYWIESNPCFANWYQPILGRSFNDYWLGRPSHLKQTLKRREKKMLRAGEVRFELSQASVDDWRRHLRDYLSIYQTSWKESEPYPEFIPGLVEIAAKRGCLRLGVLYLDDKPAAAQLWFVEQGVASIFKLAYDPGYKEFSPGTVLSARMMAHVIDVEKVNEIDFLSGDDPYKRDWMSHRRERHTIVALNRSSWRSNLWIVKEKAKRLLKR